MTTKKQSEQRKKARPTKLLEYDAVFEIIQQEREAASARRREELRATAEARFGKCLKKLDTSAKEILAEALASFHIDISRYLPGTHMLDFGVRTPTILAPDENRFPKTPVVELATDSPPTRAAVLQESRRDCDGLAHFAIRESDLLSSPVTLLLLRSERRVWCVTQPYLTSVTAKLESGGSIPDFTLHRDGLVIAIPEGASPYSLSNVVLFDSLAR